MITQDELLLQILVSNSINYSDNVHQSVTLLIENHLAGDEQIILSFSKRMTWHFFCSKSSERIGAHPSTCSCNVPII